MAKALDHESNLEALGLACEMIRLNARRSVIADATGVPEPTIRRFYDEIHKRPSQGGRAPTSSLRLLTDVDAWIDASLFASLYMRAHPRKRTSIDARTAVDTFKFYRWLQGEKANLDFNRAWLVVTDIFSGHTSLAECEQCGSTFLVLAKGDEQRLFDAVPCPGCLRRQEARGGVSAEVTLAEMRKREPERPEPVVQPAPKVAGRMRDMDEIKRYTLAMRYVRHNARVPIITFATGVPTATVRTLYNYTNARPKSGHLPESAASIFKQPGKWIQANMFAAIYRSLAPNHMAAVDSDALIRAYELYLSLGGEGEKIKLDYAWIIARDLRAKFVHLSRCRRCHGEYLKSSIPNTATFQAKYCPACVTKRKHYCTSCEKPIHGSGRCDHCSNDTRRARRGGPMEMWGRPLPS